MPIRVKTLIKMLQELDQNTYIWVAEKTWRGKPHITKERSPVSGKEEYVIHG